MATSKFATRHRDANNAAAFQPKIIAIGRKRYNVLNLIQDKGLHDTVLARITRLKELGALGADMIEDGWNDDYADRFLKHKFTLADSSFDKLLPTEMMPGLRNDLNKEMGKSWTPDDLMSKTHTNGSIVAYDQDEKEFDDLRGGEGAMVRYYKTMMESSSIKPQKNEKAFWDEFFLIQQRYVSNQASSSWSRKSQATKYWIVKNRGGSNAKYYWKEGEETAREAYEDVIADLPDPAIFGLNMTREDLFSESMSSFHAMNYSILDKADMPTKSKDGKNLLVIRTENGRSVLMNQGLGLGDEGDVIRGPLESCSMYSTFFYKGDAVVWTEVPLHRGFVSYLPGRGDVSLEFAQGRRKKGGWDNNEDMLLGDGENEIVVIMEKSRNKLMMVNDAKADPLDWFDGKDKDAVSLKMLANSSRSEYEAEQKAKAENIRAIAQKELEEQQAKQAAENLAVLKKN